MALLAAGAALLGGLTFLGGGAKAKDRAAAKPSSARSGTARTPVGASHPCVLRLDCSGVLVKSPWLVVPPPPPLHL